MRAHDHRADGRGLSAWHGRRAAGYRLAGRLDHRRDCGVVSAGGGVTNDLQTVLDRWTADAAVLRRNGEVRLADTLDRCAAEARTAAEEWLTWLSETDAELRSGYRAAYFKARREGWRRDGNARQVARFKWEYRAAVVPRRANVMRAAEEGRAAARRAQEKAA
jgi:hypothetical protein